MNTTFNASPMINNSEQSNSGDLNDRRIKKDALYKPLLRKFRTFFRKLLDERGLSKGCHYWTADRMRKQIMAYMKLLELPSAFMD